MKNIPFLANLSYGEIDFNRLWFKDRNAILSELELLALLVCRVFYSSKKRITHFVPGLTIGANAVQHPGW